MIPCIKQTTADKINLPNVHIHLTMNTYSGWNYVDHVQWVCELSGLKLSELLRLVHQNYHIFTDNEVSEVWLVSRDFWRSTARLLFRR